MTDPVTDILRMGASAEVAETWIALGEYLATVDRSASPELARLRRCYALATGAHEDAVRRLEEYMGEAPTEPI